MKFPKITQKQPHDKLAVNTSFTDKIFHIFLPVLSIIFFAYALFILHHELKIYHYHEIVHSLKSLSVNRIISAFILTGLSYSLLTGYDSLALHYIHHSISYTKIALASFISYAFSQNVGLPLVSGTPVRYRLYSGWGLSIIEIGTVVLFNGLTFALGFLTLSGVIFVSEHIYIPLSLDLPFLHSVYPLGIIFLVTVVIYIVVSGIRKNPIKIYRWEFSLPSPTISIAQVCLSSLDLITAGSVLYILFPSPPISYFHFLGIYILAMIFGVASQVPGGLGVFEATILLLLPSVMRGSTTLSALLAFRMIYYLCPLAIASVLLATHEIFEKKKGVKRFLSFFGIWVAELVPHVLAFTTFISGVILLFSNVTPESRVRLLWLSRFFPLPVLELSHFIASLIGVGLILLGRSLQRRLDAAYLLTVFLLGVGSIVSVLKGGNYEMAIILAVILVVLAPLRKHFYRKASLISQRFTPGWIIAILIALISSYWLGIFSYKHVEYSAQLWWKFALFGNAPRFLRAEIGVIALVLIFVISRLLHPALPGQELLPSFNSDIIKQILSTATKSSANLALLGDKLFLTSANQKAFIMYGIEGKSWISMGDPIGPEDEWRDLVWQFRELCDLHGGWTVFYEIDPTHIPLYLDLGLSMLKLGEDGHVPLKQFSLEGKPHKNLRYHYNRFSKEGYSFDVVPAENVAGLMPRLKDISDKWLKGKNTREKGFSLGFFKPEYIQLFPVGIVQKEGDILAFANIWSSAVKNELSVDLIRYLPDVAEGLMDYLIIQLILWGKKEGYQWFSLGMAPFSGFEKHSLAPLWNRFGNFLFQHGEHFYNFQGLRQFKNKFDPIWEPRYIACPAGKLILPQILLNCATLISGGLKGVVSK
ncbi:MAG: bifunctional lysylphosphatidylglycerol flippase/synthetase MprF [bacterium]